MANQLAQIATGFNAINDGPVLLAEQVTSGRYTIDAIKRVSIVNGHAAELGMAGALAQWTEGELQRLRRGRDWLTEAEVEVDYVLMPSDKFMDMNADYWTSFAFVAKLSAVARVVTTDGTASASAENVQALAGKDADPVRPIPARYVHADRQDGRSIEMRRYGSRRSDQS